MAADVEAGAVTTAAAVAMAVAGAGGAAMGGGGGVDRAAVGSGEVEGLARRRDDIPPLCEADEQTDEQMDPAGWDPAPGLMALVEGMGSDDVDDVHQLESNLRLCISWESNLRLCISWNRTCAPASAGSVMWPPASAVPFCTTQPPIASLSSHLHLELHLHFSN